MKLLKTYERAASPRFLGFESPDNAHFIAYDQTPDSSSNATSPISCIRGAIRNFRAPKPDPTRHGVILANTALEPLQGDVRCSLAVVTTYKMEAEIGLAGGCRAAAYDPDGFMFWTSDLGLIRRSNQEAAKSLGDEYPSEVWAAEAERMADSPPLDGKQHVHRRMRTRILRMREGSHLVVASPDAADLLTLPRLCAMIEDLPDVLQRTASAVIRDGGIYIMRAVADADVRADKELVSA